MLVELKGFEISNNIACNFSDKNGKEETEYFSSKTEAFINNLYVGKILKTSLKQFCDDF